MLGVVVTSSGRSPIEFSCSVSLKRCGNAVSDALKVRMRLRGANESQDLAAAAAALSVRAALSRGIFVRIKGWSARVCVAERTVKICVFVSVCGEGTRCSAPSPWPRPSAPGSAAP